jgi:hypothetical protein
MRSPNFWSWFDGFAGPQLAHRTEGFRKVFDYLDRFDRPVGIVETGCVRQQDNWAGDGQRTGCGPPGSPARSRANTLVPKNRG